MKYLLTLFLCMASSMATSQTAPWPTQPVKLIVSQSAGGSIDIAARLLAQKLSDALGKAVVIDNRAGANGMIAAEAVMRATDGHTFLMTSPSALTINQHVYKKVPNAPHKTAADLVAAAKAKPGAIKFASAGIGNQSQLAAELLAGAGGVSMLHVPYKGEAPALTDLIGGQVDFIFGTMPALLPQIKAGKLKALMVGQPKRSSAVADIPTASEAGFPSVNVTGWTGIVAPAGTPPAVVKRMSEEIQKILALSDIRETLVAAGAEPVGSTPEQFGEFIRTEIVKWGLAVKRAGITPD